MSITVSFFVFRQPVQALFQAQSNSVSTIIGIGNSSLFSSDGKHACVVQEQYMKYPGSYDAITSGHYSYVCAHHTPIVNAIDVGVYPEGGQADIAVVSGIVEDVSNPAGGPASWLTGDDGRNYYYAHMKKENRVFGRVKAGQVIGHIAAADENYFAKNNGVAHVHISAGTPGNGQSFADPADIPMGPLLDSWCNVNVCP